jgi:hypothetical protein
MFSNDLFSHFRQKKPQPPHIEQFAHLTLLALLKPPLKTGLPTLTGLFPSFFAKDIIFTLFTVTNKELLCFPTTPLNLFGRLV